jgi:hypothetical protein
MAQARGQYMSGLGQYAQSAQGQAGLAQAYGQLGQGLAGIGQAQQQLGQTQQGLDYQGIGAMQAQQGLDYQGIGAMQAQQGLDYQGADSQAARAQAIANASLQSRQTNDAMRLGLYDAGTTRIGAGNQLTSIGMGQSQFALNPLQSDQQGNIAYEQAMGQQNIAANQGYLSAEQQQAAQQQNQSGGIIGNVTRGIGTMLGALSDERSKERIQQLEDMNQGLQRTLEVIERARGGPAPEYPGASPQEQRLRDVYDAIDRSSVDIDALDRAGDQVVSGLSSGPATPYPGLAARELGEVEPYSYQYRPEATARFPDLAPSGRHAGLMAQDLQQSGPIGRGLVRQGPGGYLAVDSGQLAQVAAAATSDQERRLQRLESIYGGGR